MSDAGQSNAKEPRPCGECGLCCKLQAIDELQKPAGRWCAHFATRKGCAIYDARPQACRSYQCAWTMLRGFGDEWRPDRARFLMDAGEGQLVIYPDPGTPDAWRHEPFYSRIKALASRARSPFTLVLVRRRGSILVVFPEAEIDLGAERPDMEIQSGYEMRGGAPAPYARLVPRPAAS